MTDAVSHLAEAASPGSAIRAAPYLRVSTGRQAESDLSIPDQRRQAENYATSRGGTWWPSKSNLASPRLMAAALSSRAKSHRYRQRLRVRDGHTSSTFSGFRTSKNPGAVASPG